MRRAPLRRLLIGPLAALPAVAVVLLLSAAPAGAAPYTVWSCQGPNGEPLPGSAWTAATAGVGATATTDCAGGLRAGVTAGRSNGRAAGTLTFAAPPGVRITGFELQRTLRASVGGLFSSGYVASVGAVDPAGPLGAGCSGGGLSLPSTCTVGDPALVADALSIGGIAISAGCAQDSCPAATPAAEATLARSRVVLDDPQGPVTTEGGGTLRDTDRVVRSIVVAARDGGSGVASITANVDGGGSASVGGGGTCAAPYVIVQPCPTTREATFGVDTGPLKPGDHVVTGTATDAAGLTTPWGPVPFTVPSGGSSDPGPAPSGSVPVPVSPATSGAPEPTTRLTLQGTSTKDGRRRPKGYLRTRGGVPLANTTVRLTRTRGGTEAPRTVPMPSVRTGKDGRFVGAPLPEGAWTVAGAADLSSGTVTASIRLRTGLRISASPSVRRLRTGGTVVLSGRLTGAGPSRAGVRVRIQTIIKGRYSTVATVRTSSTGRWSWRYRFKRVSRPTLFAFRALVPGEGADWPWKPVSRRAAAVRVDPR